MGVSRIVRKRLQIAGEVEKEGHPRKRIFFFSDGEKAFRPQPIWMDRRPRDKHGILLGYCSQLEEKRRKEAGRG